MLFHMVPDLVLYHSDCTDGFGAAWAIWKRYPSAEFIPADHGLPPPVSCAGRRVVIVDFAYPRPILEEISEVHDHHPTPRDRKSTRLNSSHLVISYAVFCLKKKNQRDVA